MLAVAAAGYRPLPRTGSARSRLAVLVPAHNEQLLVARCVESLLAQSYPRRLYRVIVIADNCSDRTAELARTAGAEVMTRVAPDSRGKGQALRWAMDQVLASPAPPDAVVVVDADSVADRELLLNLALEHAAGHDAVQADYSILAGPEAPGAGLVAAGFLLFHRVRFSGRAALGLPANLVGNGMLFSRDLLEAQPWNAFTGVEDLEYSIRLRLAGFPVRFASSAFVYGPGAATRAGAQLQRMRWEGGRLHVARRWLGELVRTAFARRDPALLEAAFDLAIPPLGLLCMLTALGSATTGLAVLARLSPGWALAPWLVALGLVPVYVLVGLRAARAPRAVYLALAGAPAFLMRKLMAYRLLIRHHDPNRWERSDRQAAQSGRSGGRVEIAGVPVDTVDMAGALERLQAAIGGPRLFQVSTVNLDFLVRAQTDPGICRLFSRTDLNLADGAPVVWLGRLLGADVPDRVAGADLVPALLAQVARTGARVFLLGGEDGVAAEAAVRLTEQFPGLVIAGTHEPPRAAVDDMDNTGICERITAANTDILLVALGHPKQERWIDLNRERLQVSVAIGVGCVLDLIVGRSRRAPRWMQSAGLEWAFRLGQEPRRLVARYLTDAAWLIPITIRTLRSRPSLRHLEEVA